MVRKWIKAAKLTPHRSGRIVFSPPGSGKTWHVDNSTKKRWVEDDWFLDGFLHFHPPPPTANRKSHYQECDRYLQAMRDEGLWVAAVLHWDFVPDAAVFLPIDRHRQLVGKRPDLEWPAVRAIRDRMIKACKAAGVPIYTSWDDVID